MRRAAPFLLALAFAAAGGAAAQDAPRSALPGQRFEPFAPAPPAAAPEILAPAPGGPAAPPAPDHRFAFTLAEVRLTPQGAPLADTPGLRAAAEAALGQPTDLSGLEALRRRMTEALVAAGYISSGVVLREIDLDARSATFEIVEGRLTGLRVSGDGVAADGAARAPGEIDAAYVEGRLAAPEGAFNLEDIDERLRIILRDRTVERVNAAVSPGDAPGDTILDLEVEVARPYDLALTFANDNPDALGELTGRLNAAFRNLAAAGDELRVEAELTEGRRHVILDADAPLRPGGPAPFLSFEYVESEFTRAPLSTLDARNAFLRFGGGVSLPVIETSRRSLTAIVGFDWKRSRSRLLGENFSFSAGAENGITKTSVLSLAAEYVDLGEDRTIALRAAANLGLPILGASDAGGGAPDGEFAYLVAQAQVTQRLSPAFTLIGRVQGQVADGALLPLEQAAIGGRDTVRGYGEAIVSGDDALVGSLEGRLSLMDLPLPEVTPPGAPAPLTLAPFIDAGAVWRRGGGGDTLVGAGAGLLWSPRPGIDAALYLGAALDGGTGARGLQGEGVHFAVLVALP